MPFLDSNTIRPLYDVKDGGPPKGFECQFQGGHGYKCNHPDCIPCGRVTRTLPGMRAHQRIVHGVKPQTEFQFSDIIATKESQP